MHEPGPPPPPAPREESLATSIIERTVLVFVRDPLLRPVLFVLVAHVVAFVAPAILFAVRDRTGLGMASLFLLLLGSAAGVRHEVGERGGPGALTWLLLAVWVLAAIVAWTADHYGIF